jgi:hypothetical protein
VHWDRSQPAPHVLGRLADVLQTVPWANMKQRLFQRGLRVAVGKRDVLLQVLVDLREATLDRVRAGLVPARTVTSARWLTITMTLSGLSRVDSLWDVDNLRALLPHRLFQPVEPTLSEPVQRAVVQH